MQKSHNFSISCILEDFNITKSNVIQYMRIIIKDGLGY